MRPVARPPGHATVSRRAAGPRLQAARKLRAGGTADADQLDGPSPMVRKAGKAANNRMPAATRRRGRHPKTNRQQARPQRQPVEISGRRKAGRGTNPVPPSFWERARAQCVGGAPAFCVRARERERGSTPAFFVCARKRNVRTRGRRSAPAVSCKWHETELSGGRYIGEAENGRKLNFPSLDPLDSMLSDSESSISCPKSSHEQVKRFGKSEIVPKIRARLFGDSESPKSCQPQTAKPAARLWRFLGWAEPSLDPTGNRATLRGIGRYGGFGRSGSPRRFGR